MEIHLNISFPRIPCELLTLDVMDVSGEQQTGVQHGIHKVRLAPAAEGGRELDKTVVDLHAEDEAALHLAPDYCGSCYSANPPPKAKKEGCCTTCQEVREAYAAMSWAFGRGEGVEQCEREHYGERLDEQRKEGCRVEGGLRVNKVVGNFHVAPGRSFSNGNMHVHDLKNYYDAPPDTRHTFSHKIHALRFGPQPSEELQRRLGGSTEGVLLATSQRLNPLDDTAQDTDETAYNYMYFIKVVSTSYLPLGARESVGDALRKELAPLGSHDVNADGSLETHQYSVTSHKRSLEGGTDEAEGHAERIHARDGIPGVFFPYVRSPFTLAVLHASGSTMLTFLTQDISPMKVINREERSKSFIGFLTGVCAVIGGTLTVAAAIDRGLYEGVTRIRKLHQR